MFFVFSPYSLVLCIQVAFFVVYVLDQTHRRFQTFSVSWMTHNLILVILVLSIGFLAWYALSFLYELIFADKQRNEMTSNIYVIISFPILAFVISLLSVKWLRKFK